MLMAGAMTATGHLAPGPSIALAVAACLISNSVWYALGRARNGRVVRLLRALSPSTCQTRKRGLDHRRAVLVFLAKFMPAIGWIAGLVAARAGISYRRFIVIDAAGALIWASTYIGLGRFVGVTARLGPRSFDIPAPFAAAAIGLVVTGALVIRVIRRLRARRLS
jgi:membrane protein DedA with SNARE-associated domain